MSPVLIATAIFLGIFTQSLTGFGLGLVSMALLAEPLGVQTATPLIALVAITCEIVMLFRIERVQPEAVRRLALAR
jgi:uncharacterized membrane protein YfcA